MITCNNLNCCLTLSLCLMLIKNGGFFLFDEFWRRATASIFISPYVRVSRRDNVERNDLFIQTLRFKVCSELVILWLIAGIFEEKEKKGRRRMEVVYDITGRGVGSLSFFGLFAIFSRGRSVHFRQGGRSASAHLHYKIVFWKSNGSTLWQLRLHLSTLFAIFLTLCSV